MSDWQNVDGFAAIRRRRRREIIFSFFSMREELRELLRRWQFRLPGKRRQKRFSVEFEAVFAV